MNIPKHLNTIISENHDPLISKIKSDLIRWNLVPFLGLGQRVECQISSDISLQAIIGVSGLVASLKYINPLIKMSIKIWHRVVNENKAKEPYWIIRWIGYDSDFLPNSMDARFKQCADEG